MPLSGLAAGGGMEALQEFLAQMVMQQRLKQQAAQQERQMAMDEARFRETVRGNRFDEDRIRRADQVGNAGGILENLDAGFDPASGVDQDVSASDAAALAGTPSAARLRKIMNLKARPTDPAMAATMSQEPTVTVTRLAPTGEQQAERRALNAPQKINLTRVRTGKPGEPIEKAFTDEELQSGVPSYREPDKPERGPAPDYEWIVRNGKPLQIRTGTAQPGDTPYDAVAVRQKPDASGPSPYSQERKARTLQSVDELMGKVNRWTTGMGSLLSSIPESDARNFAAELDTLKANIAFNELTEMREASKTGGALGQVSNVELGLLQSALGALDAGQSPGNIRAQLQKIKDSIGRWSAAQGRQIGGGRRFEILGVK